MTIVYTETPTCTANVAEGTVVNLLRRTIIIEMANLAVPFCECFPTHLAFRIAALLTNWLKRAALYAEDLGDFIPI
jgi:hypothetical protein